MLAVNPALQSLGYGKQMLEYAEQYAGSVFRVNTVKMVVVSERGKLIAFYKRRGYSKTGITADFPLSIGAGTPMNSGLKVEFLVNNIQDRNA